MTAQIPVLRETINNANPNEIADTFRQLFFGELVGLLIQGIGYTETGLTATSNVGTLANVPTMVYDVVVTAGTVTGRKTLKIGGTPATGEVVWGGIGSKALTFAAGDAVTTYSVKYARADLVNTKTSVMERALGQRD